jgi:hypothetical protein
MAYRDCSIFEAPILSSPRLSLEGNAFQQNFEHAWNQFGVRGQVVIFCILLWKSSIIFTVVVLLQDISKVVMYYPVFRIRDFLVRIRCFSV